MESIYAVILAGGKGLRFGNNTPKQFLTLSDKPIIARTLEKFCHTPEINGIIIVTPLEYINHTEEIIKNYGITKIKKIMPGGKTRQGSSYNAICCHNFNDTDILIFHDAVRPFISKKIIDECIEETKKHGAAGVYVKAIDTIAEIMDSRVQSIPDREKLYYAQTPQAFRYKIIKHSHKIAISGDVLDASDDISLVLNAGYEVKVIEGDYENIKITTPFDYEIAKFIQNQRS